MKYYYINGVPNIPSSFPLYPKLFPMLLLTPCYSFCCIIIIIIIIIISYDHRRIVSREAYDIEENTIH